VPSRLWHPSLLSAPGDCLASAEETASLRSPVRCRRSPVASVGEGNHVDRYGLPDTDEAGIIIREVGLDLEATGRREDAHHH
jgi:hypothetical protein